MNEFERRSTSQQVSRLNVSPLEVDMQSSQEVGRAFFALLYRLLRIGTIRDPEHEQTQKALDDLLELLEQTGAKTSVSSLRLAIEGEVAEVNGTILSLNPNEQRRLDELRDVYDAAGVRAIGLEVAIDREQAVRFLRQVHRVANSEYADDLDAVDFAHVTVRPGSTQRPLERALHGVPISHYAAHLFTRLLVKTRALHRRLRLGPDEPFDLTPFRRAFDRLTRLFASKRCSVLGFGALELLSPSRATHSVHSAMYAVFTALRAGTTIDRARALGTAILLEDVAALRGYPRVAPERAAAIASDEESPPSNLKAAAEGMHVADGSPGAALADVLLYERGGGRSSKLGPPLYSDPEQPHAASRLVDLVRFYDAEIQGRRGESRTPPVEALRRVESTAGDSLDPRLTEFFIASMGRYPVGTSLRLSTGHAGVVVAPPKPGAPPERPTIRPFDYLDRTVDLADPDWESISVERRVTPPSHISLPSVLIHCSTGS